MILPFSRLSLEKEARGDLKHTRGNIGDIYTAAKLVEGLVCASDSWQANLCRELSSDEATIDRLKLREEKEKPALIQLC